MNDEDPVYGICPEHGEIAAEVSYDARSYPNCPLCGYALEMDDEFRPPCEEVANLSPTANYGELERRVCAWCRLYFDTGPNTETAFCSGACQRRYHQNMRTEERRSDTPEKGAGVKTEGLK